MDELERRVFVGKRDNLRRCGTLFNERLEFLFYAKTRKSMNELGILYRREWGSIFVIVRRCNLYPVERYE